MGCEYWRMLLTFQKSSTVGWGGGKVKFVIVSPTISLGRVNSFVSSSSFDKYIYSYDYDQLNSNPSLDSNFDCEGFNLLMKTILTNGLDRGKSKGVLLSQL